jgi:hypothetical protein
VGSEGATCCDQGRGYFIVNGTVTANNPSSSSSSSSPSSLQSTSSNSASTTSSSGASAAGSKATQSPKSDSKGTNTGAIIGGVIGGIVGLAFLIAALLWALAYMRRRKRNKQYPELSQYGDAKLKEMLSPGPPPTELPGDGTYFGNGAGKGQSPSPAGRAELPASTKGGVAV